MRPLSVYVSECIIYGLAERCSPALSKHNYHLQTPFVVILTHTGNPAKIVGEVSESHPTSAQFDAKNVFKKFKPIKQ